MNAPLVPCTVRWIETFRPGQERAAVVTRVRPVDRGTEVEFFAYGPEGRTPFALSYPPGRPAPKVGQLGTLVFFDPGWLSSYGVMWRFVPLYPEKRDDRRLAP